MMVLLTQNLYLGVDDGVWVLLLSSVDGGAAPEVEEEEEEDSEIRALRMELMMLLFHVWVEAWS